MANHNMRITIAQKIVLRFKKNTTETLPNNGITEQICLNLRKTQEKNHQYFGDLNVSDIIVMFNNAVENHLTKQL